MLKIRILCYLGKNWNTIATEMTAIGFYIAIALVEVYIRHLLNKSILNRQK